MSHTDVRKRKQEGALRSLENEDEDALEVSRAKEEGMRDVDSLSTK